MAVNKPLQALTPGLLNLLGIKNNGLQPDELLMQLQPVMDLSPWYYEGQAVDIAATRNSATADEGFQAWTGGPGALVVPQGQTWLVTRYTVYAVLAAATDIIRFAPCMQAVVGLQTIYQLGAPSSDSPQAGAAGQTRYEVASANVPLIARGGQNLGVLIQAIDTAGVIAMQANLRYVPLVS